MRHSPAKFLFDAKQAASLISGFVAGKNLADYSANNLLRSGVERQLITIGEALSKLSRLSPDIAARISNYQKIVAFRNLAVHGYDLLDDETVWGIVKIHLPVLEKELEVLLKE
ncbi:MAG: DUF86 domain-containing protein [Nitrospinae bacterium]|nr:DUF86 domain-containing protein [Nitrospinota bacterium]